MSTDGIEPVSPAGAMSEPETQGASYPNEQGYGLTLPPFLTQKEIIVTTFSGLLLVKKKKKGG